ncbi:sensor histidine kinase [Gemmobacter denitrificans]|uniref:histidine kinase n=1 Tax=Gemmobacter denitrificans TaxID=3123040 RepID=A0ABU8BTB1_9RHOB
MIFALPCIVTRGQDDFEFLQGRLFPLPPELSTNYQIKKYSEARIIGWSRCDLGYWTFTTTHETGRFIVPGLHLTDAERPRKRIHGHNAMFSKRQIEGYTADFFAAMRDSKVEAEKALTSLVHDLRHLSHSIYHSALEVEDSCRNRNTAQALEKIKSVIASQAMLKVRIDYLDFSNSVDRFSEIEEIPVYSRVDKVKRCFSSNANSKNIDLHLVGESFRLARGPNILDIVTYTFVENAIKYSPCNQHVEILVSDTDCATRVSVSSLGPAIEKGELLEIFNNGQRGKNAVKVRPSGTGLGLSVARDIIDVFSGSIGVTPSGEIKNVDGVPFQRVTFFFQIPTSGEDAKRKSRIEKFRSQRRKAQILTT